MCYSYLSKIAIYSLMIRFSYVWLTFLRIYLWNFSFRVGSKTLWLLTIEFLVGLSYPKPLNIDFKPELTLGWWLFWYGVSACLIVLLRPVTDSIGLGDFLDSLRCLISSKFKFILFLILIIGPNLYLPLPDYRKRHCPWRQQGPSGTDWDIEWSDF